MTDNPPDTFDGFDTASEVERTLYFSNAEADYRVEIVRVIQGGSPGLKPRVYRQETITVPGDFRNPKAREMLVWREYEMGYKPTEDADTALKVALAVIRGHRGR